MSSGLLGGEVCESTDALGGKAGRCSLLPASEVLQNSVHVLFLAQSLKERKQVQQLGVGHVIEPRLHGNLRRKKKKTKKRRSEGSTTVTDKKKNPCCVVKLVYTRVTRITNLIADFSSRNVREAHLFVHRRPFQTPRRCRILDSDWSEGLD